MAGSGDAGAARTSGSRQVLVVEDQQWLSEIIAEWLAPDFEVLCATTVAEGVELLMATAVDVVLLDCVLPGETMWQIVLEADRQDVPVVLMTGDAAQMRDAAAGARPHIFKPFRSADLKRVLEDALARATRYTGSCGLLRSLARVNNPEAKRPWSAAPHTGNPASL